MVKMLLHIGIFLLGFLGTITCRPQGPPVPLGSGTTPVSIISQTESVDANGNFNFSYETSNGIKVDEAGVIKHITGLRSRGNFAADDNTPDEDDILVQTGGFSYTAPDGTLISLRYTADENGFQPVGDHLPTPPPIPSDILRSLPQAGDQQDIQQRQQPFGQQPTRQQPFSQQPTGQQPTGQQPFGQQPFAQQPATLQSFGQQPQAAVAPTQNIPQTS